jgi:hypothetical protein
MEAVIIFDFLGSLLDFLYSQHDIPTALALHHKDN